MIYFFQVPDNKIIALDHSTELDIARQRKTGVVVREGHLSCFRNSGGPVCGSPERDDHPLEYQCGGNYREYGDHRDSAGLKSFSV